MVGSFRGAAETIEYLSGAGRAVYLCEQAETLRALALYIQREARENDGPAPEVAARGNGGGGLELCGVARAGDTWRVSTPWAMWTKGTEEKAPLDLDSLHPAARPVMVAREWSRVVESVGLPGSKLSAGTAAVELLPLSWIKASRKFAAGEAWREVRQAYYGGRVELYRKGYKGPAVEHDLRSAYGAALAGLLGWMPDFQLYPERRPLPGQPAWYDATVRVSGRIGPLPYRDPVKPWSITWPTSGQWRGWYTREDLETPGVHIVEIHKSHAGRYRDTLSRPVSAILELREKSDPWARSVLRQLVVSLAGKMGQKPVKWRVWDPPPIRQPLPPGLRSMGDPFGDCLMVYPSEPAVYPPTIVPQVASYVTARTRRHLHRALVDAGPGVIYCDTDAVHLPAGAAAPANSGPRPGQWCAKVEGKAHYVARRNYKLGKKFVNYVPR